MTGWHSNRAVIARNARIVADFERILNDPAATADQIDAARDAVAALPRFYDKPPRVLYDEVVPTQLKHSAGSRAGYELGTILSHARSGRKAEVVRDDSNPFGFSIFIRYLDGDRRTMLLCNERHFEMWGITPPPPLPKHIARELLKTWRPKWYIQKYGNPK